MYILYIIIGVVIFNSVWIYVSTKRAKRSANFDHDHKKYMHAWHERIKHEEEYGGENTVTNIRLQELIRIEAGALSILRNYYPEKSEYLEISLRTLTKRIDSVVIH